MRFGISETSWILPKILRIRRGAVVERWSVAGAALVAMKIFRLVCLPRPARGPFHGCAETQKAARSLWSRTAASASDSRQPIHACDALRDGASCPERLWRGFYLGAGSGVVKTRGAESAQ